MDPSADTASAEICALLRRAAPAGWASVTLRVWANVMSYEIAVSARDANGRPGGAADQPQVTDALIELRDAMYDSERGAWLSATFVVHRDDAPEISFNYDDDPGWSPDLHPVMYLRDLETYPRAEQHIPHWLRERAALGRELEREHEAGNAGQ